MSKSSRKPPVPRPAILMTPAPDIAAAPFPVETPATETVALPPVEPVVVEPVVQADTADIPPAVAAAPDSTHADITQKEDTIMATAFETPEIVTDMNDRAKSALEKGGRMAQELGEFGKGNVEALVESGRIAARGFESIGQDAAEYSRRSFEGLTATLKSLASVKSPTELFKLQSDYVRSSFDSAVAEVSKGTETLIKLAGDAAQPLSNRFAVAAEKVKSVA